MTTTSTTYQRSSSTSSSAVLLRVPMVVEIRPAAAADHHHHLSNSSRRYGEEKEMDENDDDDDEVCEVSLFLETAAAPANVVVDIEAAVPLPPRAAPLRRVNSATSCTSTSSRSSSAHLCPTLLTVNKTALEAAAAVAAETAACCPCASALDAKSSSTTSSQSPTTLSSSSSSSSPSTTLCKLVFGAAGVYFSYMLYGHYQEDLFLYKSSILDGAKFRHAWFLQTLESLGSATLGYLAKRRFDYNNNNNKSSSKNNRSLLNSSSLPLTPFFATGAAQVCAKGFTSLALAAGLSFPVCTLAKSAKMIPVMLGQLVLGGSSYSVTDYTMAALIVSGATMLSMGSESSSHSSVGNNSTFMGVALILLSLFMDGITAGLQKRLKHHLAVVHLQQATTYDFLLYTSTSMFLTALFVSIVITDDLRSGYQYVMLNPGAFQHALFMVCLCSVIGQSFVFYLVAQFDPLVCSTVTTTRKISSVVWSIHAKGHVLSQQGALGLALAMAGIALELRDKCNVVVTTGTSTTTASSSTTLLPRSMSMKQLLPVSCPTMTAKTAGVNKSTTTPYSSSRRNSMSTTACNSSCSEDSEDE